MSVTEIIEGLSEPVKHSLDVLSVGTVLVSFISWLLASFVGLLPVIGAILSVVWLSLRVRTALLDHLIRKQEYELNARKLRE